MWKVISSACRKVKRLLVSWYGKCIFKVGTPEKPLALVPKSKVVWTDTSVEVKAEDHDTFTKSNVVPSTIFVMDVLNDFNL